MASIACLGWGSLIWSPRELPIRRQWFADGPLIQVEFARKAKDGRLTLALTETDFRVRSLFALMENGNDLDAACDALRKREGIPAALGQQHIGRWSRGDAAPLYIEHLPQWAEARGFDHIIWTGLPPGLEPPGPKPGLDDIFAYLDGLTGETRDVAENYIRRAPRQTDTDYRRAIEARYGWLPLD